MNTKISGDCPNQCLASTNDSNFRQKKNDQVVHLVEFPDADVKENQEKEKKRNLMEKLGKICDRKSTPEVSGKHREGENSLLDRLIKTQFI